jgi:pimeloyl-ACP methyl ester carboxylesterase
VTTNPFYKSEEGQQAVISFYEDLLRRWPVQREGMTIPTEYGDTFIIACGAPDAPPVLLLHGSTSNSATWGGDVEALSRHFRVYAVDIPGEPGKSAPNRMSWDEDTPIEWLGQVLDALGITKVSLVGMSLGAWLALRFAAAHPDQIERLILICPGGIAPARVSFIFRAIALSFLGRRGTERINQIMLPDRRVPPELNDFSWLLTHHFKMRTDTMPIVSDQELQSLSMPTLVLMGGEDALLDTNKTIARLREQAPNLTAEVFPEEGHAVIGKTDRILSFLLGRH